MEESKQNYPIEMKETKLNRHIDDLEVDTYYHLGLNSSQDLPSLFGDVKFVLLCGSRNRSRTIAERIMTEFATEFNLSKDEKITAIGSTDRFELYKTGQVISVSHGMGNGSISILLHEITKMLVKAGAINVMYMRIGTSGGFGVPAGTVVVSTETLNDSLEDCYKINILGKETKRPCTLNKELAHEVADATHDIKIVHGKTISCDTFYESQCRIDGAICEYTAKDKMDFILRCQEAGAVNMEMEATGFASFCQYLKIPAALICVTLLDRTKGDQVNIPSEIYSEWINRPITVAFNYIKWRLKNFACDSKLSVMLADQNLYSGGVFHPFSLKQRN